MKKSKRKILIIVTIILCISVITLFPIIGKMITLENDVEVAPDSYLTYYLDVKYDGIDVNGVHSSDSIVSEVNSGEMYVEDILPKGLIFQNFTSTTDGTIGAVKRSDDVSHCDGYVIDDTHETETTNTTCDSDGNCYYHGLHYDASTRKVFFKVKGLKAGCKLTVGIRTKTPSSPDNPDTSAVEKRIDFYNVATIKERFFQKQSNMVHAFMGSPAVKMYEVKYQYIGTVPDNAPELPETRMYSYGTSVEVVPPVELEGYTFSGWSKSIFTISSNTTITGYFTKNYSYNVTYSLAGDVPSGYSVPEQKSYSKNQIVEVDSLKEGDIFNGYRFSGWKTTDATISSNNEFTMPSKNVTLKGSFEPVKYKVKYQFTGSVLPPNANSNLPADGEYEEGDTVTLAPVSNPPGYKFVGWLYDNQLQMPGEDITVYGEWKKYMGTYTLRMSQVFLTPRIVDTGDELIVKFIIENNNKFDVTNVMVKRVQSPDFVFKSITGNSGYSEISDEIFMIDSIPALSSKEIAFKYDMDDLSIDKIISKFTLLGASNGAGYELELVEPIYREENLNFYTGLKLCNEINGHDSNNTFQYKITNESNSFETWIALKNNECRVLKLESGAYRIKEIVPQEYEIDNVSGSATRDNQLIYYSANHVNNIQYNNKFKKKGFMHSFGRVVNKILGGA